MSRTLPRRRRRAIHALVQRGACTHAHLATLLNSCARVAANRRARSRAVEFVLNEAMVSVWSFRRDGRFVDDAGPDSGEGEEDADDGQDLGAEFRDVVLELEG